MIRVATILAMLVALAAAGCGGAFQQATTVQPHQAGRCASVSVGQGASASVDTFRHVACGTAQQVVRQWAGQQAGGADAHLPSGWRCDGNSVCRSGDAVVTMTLAFS